VPLRTTVSGNETPRLRARGRRATPESPVSTARSIDSMSAPTSYGRNEPIFFEGDPADSIYKVESGCVRTYNTLDSGPRQLVSLYLAGDFFGLEGGDHHVVSAETTTASKIHVIKRRALMARKDNAAMIRNLLDLTAKDLRRAQRHNLLLLKGAQERVIGFLLDMQERGHGQNEIALHMTRRDIADYLGLTIETVSRTLSRLESESAISLPSPWRVVLNDPGMLN